MTNDDREFWLNLSIKLLEEAKWAENKEKASCITLLGIATAISKALKETT